MRLTTKTNHNPWVEISKFSGGTAGSNIQLQKAFEGEPVYANHLLQGADSNSGMRATLIRWK